MRAVVAGVFLLCATVQAQDLSPFEKVLVPVLSTATIVGANDTRFTTELLVVTPQPIDFYPAVSSTGTPSVGRYGASPVYESTPRSAGRLLYFERSKMTAVSFFYELRVNAFEHRTTLPVARERDFKTGTTVLYGLTPQPIDYAMGIFQSRYRLRIYDVDNTGDLSVVVRASLPPAPYAVYPIFDGRVESRDGDDVSYPTYVDIPVPNICEVLTPVTVPCKSSPLTITIEPSDPTIRYWAFLTRTDNVTSETTAFFAQ